MEPIIRVSSPEEQERTRLEGGAEGDKIICIKCGNEGIRLHRGCKFCDDCCDCRPLGT